MSIRYFFRIGDQDTKTEPGGIFRVIDDEGGLRHEFLNERGEWIQAADLERHFSGPDFSTDVFEVTIDQAEKAIAAWPKRIAAAAG